MLLTCPACRAECTVDEKSADTASCPSCGQLLVTRSATPPVQVILSDTPAAKDETREWRGGNLATAAGIDELPVRLGRYFIESLIAIGGFARVYLATDEELGRRVALKIPRPERFQNPAKLRQFLAEARIAAKLRHPGVVTIFDVGQLSEGLNYIAMEYIAGESLAKLIANDRLPLRRTVELLIEIADAVHEAHRLGLVHRDLKPSNILIDEHGKPRVVDFGLAVHEEAQMKLQGEVAGTPAYMSPEQYRGEVHRLDGRTDIWSLGVCLYQLLTGRRPFTGDTRQLYDEVLNRAPKPPRQIDDQIPREVEAICLKCLSKSIADRYTTAKDLADDLRNWLAADSSRRSVHEAEFRGTIPQAADTSPKPKSNRTRSRLLWGSLLAIGLFLTISLAAIMAPSRLSRDDQLLEARGERFTWIDTLNHPPKRVVWGGDAPDTRSDYDDKRRDLLVSTRGIGLYSFGRTDSEKYRFQVGISRMEWKGSVGLFWDFHSVQNESGQVVQRCQMLYVHSWLDRNTGSLAYRIDRSEFEFRPVKGVIFPEVNEKGISHQMISPPGDGDHILDVTIANGRVVAARWREQELTEVIDRPPQFGDFVQPQYLSGTHTVKVGVFHSNGTTQFRDGRFMDVSP